MYILCICGGPMCVLVLLQTPSVVEKDETYVYFSHTDSSEVPAP